METIIDYYCRIGPGWEDQDYRILSFLLLTFLSVTFHRLFYSHTHTSQFVSNYWKLFLLLIWPSKNCMLEFVCEERVKWMNYGTKKFYWNLPNINWRKCRERVDECDEIVHNGKKNIRKWVNKSLSKQHRFYFSWEMSAIVYDTIMTVWGSIEICSADILLAHDC